ncbi:uncharacterized protein PAC_19263 [Phialocephala subalpina]|uniref:Uncharacterized protein n=1 Tax=Phialocephala subalpina TaxID=576137 RepID=A0A1L7XWD7_9HELO|nr:uncharacterized protein PAC_19263 [Phialocephala subalpina]
MGNSGRTGRCLSSRGTRLPSLFSDSAHMLEFRDVQETCQFLTPENSIPENRLIGTFPTVPREFIKLHKHSREFKAKVVAAEKANEPKQAPPQENTLHSLLGELINEVRGLKEVYMLTHNIVESEVDGAGEVPEGVSVEVRRHFTTSSF